MADYLLDTHRLRGIVTPMVTPLTDDHAIDHASIARLVDWLCEAGVAGILVLGSTGESPLLTDVQQVEVVRATVEAAHGRAPVLAGILDTGTRRARERGRAARDVGADAVVATAPFYLLHSQEELLLHFRAIHEVGLPVVAYDVPVWVKVELSLDTVCRLMEEGTIIGIKDSTSDIQRWRKLAVALRGADHFRILVGSELMVDVAIFLGADGAVPGVSNVIPETYVELYIAAASGSWAQARELQEQVMTLSGILHQGKSGGSFAASAIGGVKVALKHLGIISSSALAGPLLPLTPEEEERIRQIMDGCGLI